MPPKIKVPDGELTSTELRKLIRGHNILVSIKIPKGTDRDGLIALIKSKGYKVDHKKKAIIDSKADRPRRPQVTLEKAKELTKPKPVSEAEKKKRQQARQKKKGEKAFLKVAIPKAPPVSKKPSKVIKVGKPPPMKAKTSTKKAYKEGYDEGKDQAIDDLDSEDFDDAEVLNPTAPIVTDYPTKEEQKAVITGWKDGYLEVMKKNGNPHLNSTPPKAKTPAPKAKAKTPAPKASPAFLVDDDKNKEFLNKLIADVDAFNKKYTAAKFRKLDKAERSKLLKVYNDDASVLQRDNLKLKDKIKNKDGTQSKFYDDYLELIKTVSRSFKKFSSVRKAIKKLI
tara:strand:- start:1212 stop:2228 length:1017 start_codon:yes stop_codon:yes gene_type:complete